MKKLFLIFCFSPLAFILFAQTDEVVEIRNYYNELKESMKEAEAHSGEYEFINYYVVKIQENLHGMSMPAVGNYSGTTEKWFENDEENYGMDGRLVYKKSTFEIAARTEFTEYVFKEGELIFCFLRTAGAEYRYYFKDDLLINYLAKNGEGDWNYYEKSDSEHLLKRAFD
ncbi:MAG: hypothetical protein ACI865_001781 [Flavobacteriaceae bacterium]|jgi:hypothetical protein